MTNPKTVFVCQECGAQSPKWLGRCADCGAWNSFVEERAAGGAPRAAAGASVRAGRQRRRARAVCGHRDRAARAAVDRHRRVRSRARRRRRARIARAARRRAGHRQVDAAAAGGGEHGAHDRPGALQLGRGIRAPDQIARRAARRRRRAALPAGRDVPRAHPRGDRAHQAGARHRRFDPDGVLAEVSVGARQHRPGARRRRRSCCSPRRGRTSRRFSSAT